MPDGDRNLIPWEDLDPLAVRLWAQGDDDRSVHAALSVEVQRLYSRSQGISLRSLKQRKQRLRAQGRLGGAVTLNIRPEDSFADLIAIRADIASVPEKKKRKQLRYHFATLKEAFEVEKDRLANGRKSEDTGGIRNPRQERIGQLFLADRAALEQAETLEDYFHICYDSRNSPGLVESRPMPLQHARHLEPAIVQNLAPAIDHSRQSTTNGSRAAEAEMTDVLSHNVDILLQAAEIRSPSTMQDIKPSIKEVTPERPPHPFSCPYWTHAPQEFNRCREYSFSRFALVKEHVLKIHLMPFNCPNCSERFGGSIDRHHHLSQCTPEDPKPHRNILPPSETELNLASRLQSCNSYAEIFDILFPRVEIERPERIRTPAQILELVDHSLVATIKQNRGERQLENFVEDIRLAIEGVERHWKANLGPTRQ